MSSSCLLRKHSKPSSILSILTHVRSMGGGPRTFKGGISKWQHKRMHEKLAMEKERKLLNQEKQLYQARLRSEIRAKASGTAASSSSQPSGAIGPMTSKDHIKALADRFMKAGAEDLWNRDDGPDRSSNRGRDRERDRDRSPPPLDMRKIIGRPGSIGQQRREYSKWRRNESSDEDDDGVVLDSGRIGNKFSKRGMEFLKSGNENEEEEVEEGFGSGRRKEMRSEAALRNYDVKREKRRVLKEGDWSERIWELREEVREEQHRRVGGVFAGRREEAHARGSVLTEKR